ncbi:inter-alpha-trypsin inhibitor heavy chain H2 [Brienomyrus brachyistius]|uniref:inter-alpha-trypsin inhibitor heavy chain H2 n=1 Tax=Brienomyrus brachyistius TaxID=42636 RepID=UPI0020B4441C|nr:inter-alpha-trypsin inhibitor heavy chain H2 [Brienomyrus brachyistius]
MRPLLLLFLLLLALGAEAFIFTYGGQHSMEHLRDEEPGEHLSARFRRSLVEDEEGIGDSEAEVDRGIVVRSYKVESRITLRFAHTTVTSVVSNLAKDGQSVAFNTQIPKRGFITNFTMNVNQVTYVGSVMEKTKARNLYIQARAQGKAAAIVRSSTQDMEVFKTEVYVPPGSQIEFELHYQELLPRKLGSYEHTLYLQPGRLVPDLQVDVYIYEPKGITFVETPENLGEQFVGLIEVATTGNKAHVGFRPTLEQQRRCKNCSSTAVNGVFTVKYDVNRDGDAMELQVSDGHFVQFFAPERLDPLPKNIVFVIDVSGSMWGLKMRQMVEAMQTILDDLRMDDYFSIIDFNHNVRCWSEDLVPGTNIQVAEAKKYIQAIKPNGGTNINEALLRAIHMLTRASNEGLIDHRSVSMIILFSDGDPTVGEIKLKAIQRNVKRYMREQFSLFSLGIGFDVDFDFLERIAMENRGVARRVHAIQGATEQMRSFYNELSSPLLRNIIFQSLKDSLSDVTESRFDKFFKGSEIVVAGKVASCDSNVLEAMITASAAKQDFQITAKADCEVLDRDLILQPHTFAGFSKQMWAYLVINQLLADRSLASTAAKKRKITEKIVKLATEHQFVTPLTAMLVESEGGQERLLADSPKDPKQGCCLGPVSNGKVTVVHGVPPWTLATPVPTPAATRTEIIRVNIVENDPHFTVYLPKAQLDICFNIDSEPGDILSLVSDPGLGVVVNGKLIAGKQMKNNKLNTYFGTISIYYRPLGVRVDVSTQLITVIDGEDKHAISWASATDATFGGVKISIMKDAKVNVTLRDNISFMVVLHRVWKKHPFNVDFLGLYTPDDNAFSPLVHGLIGQFTIEPTVKVYEIHEGTDPMKMEATMEVKGNKLAVTRGWQKDYRKNRKYGSNVFCWFIHNSGKGFIDGHYKKYIVPRLDSFL